jgi:hypothetical protein
MAITTGVASPKQGDDIPSPHCIASPGTSGNTGINQSEDISHRDSTAIIGKKKKTPVKKGLPTVKKQKKHTQCSLSQVEKTPGKEEKEDSLKNNLHTNCNAT